MKNRVFFLLAAMALLISACAGNKGSKGEGGGSDSPQSASRTDRFVYFTDAHVDVRIPNSTGNVLDSVLRNNEVSRVVFGGDATMTTSACRTKADIDKSLEMFGDYVKVARRHNCEFLPLRGNHEITTGTVDTSVPGYTYSQQYVYETVMGWAEGADIVEMGNGTCNYYFESLDAKMRYIVLDPYASAGEDLEQRYGINIECMQDATNWLRDCIATLPEDWKAVVLIHQGMNKCTGISDYGNCSGMLRIVNANADKVVMVLHGHLHKDVETFENGVLHVGTTCSNWGQAVADIWGKPVRERGTDTESAVDVVSIDLDNSRIEMHRYGGGYNRNFNLTPIRMAVGETFKLESNLGRVYKWTLYDADGIHAKVWTNWENDAYYTNRYATLEEDTVTAVRRGDAVAIATDEISKTREYFYITIER